MPDDLFGAPSRDLRAVPVAKRPYAKPQVTVRAWNGCPHTPPCHNSTWCATGIRDARDLQKKLGCSVDEAIRRARLGERA